MLTSVPVRRPTSTEPTTPAPAETGAASVNVTPAESETPSTSHDIARRGREKSRRVASTSKDR